MQRAATTSLESFGAWGRMEKLKTGLASYLGSADGGCATRYGGPDSSGFLKPMLPDFAIKAFLFQTRCA